MLRFSSTGPTAARRMATLLAVVSLMGALSCSSDGGGPSNTVATVVITTPSTGPLFQTLGRTLQFGAEARRSNNEPLAGAFITWSSSNSGVASVSGTGLVAAVSNAI